MRMSTREWMIRQKPVVSGFASGGLVPHDSEYKFGGNCTKLTLTFNPLSRPEVGFRVINNEEHGFLIFMGTIQWSEDMGDFIFLPQGYIIEGRGTNPEITAEHMQAIAAKIQELRKIWPPEKSQ